MGKAKGCIVCDYVTHDLVGILSRYYTAQLYRTSIPHGYI